MTANFLRNALLKTSSKIFELLGDTYKEAKFTYIILWLKRQR